MKNEILKLVTAEKGSKTKLRNVLKKHSLLDLILSSKPNTNDLHEHSIGGIMTFLNTQINARLALKNCITLKILK